MTILKLIRFALAGMLFGFASILTASAEEFGKSDIEGIVRDFLLKNPEIVQEALVALERKRQEQETAARAQTIESRQGILFNSVHQAELGNSDGDVTIVEFFDYNCGFCKRAFPDMVKLLEEDPNLRIVMKEFPVLGEGSVEAARVSVVVQKIDPDKYLEFHATLLSQRGQANKFTAMEAAVQVGLDRAEIEKRLSENETTTAIEEVYALANSLGLTGTPSYVVGDEVVMGAVGYEALSQKIKAARECTAEVC